MKLRRRWPILLTGVVALISLSALTTDAVATDKDGPKVVVAPPTDDDDAWMLAQLPLDLAADKISAIIDSSGQPGFTSLSVDVPKGSLVLRWKGALPNAVASALSDTRRRGIPVNVLEAKYSLSELEEQGRSIIAEERAKKVADAYRVVAFTPLNDGTGLEVDVAQLNAEAATNRAKYAVVRTVQSGKAIPLSIYRQDDTAPYWAGGRLVFSSGQQCSSAFGANKDGTKKYLLTAGHCGGSLDSVKNGAGTYLGSVAGDVHPFDNNDAMSLNVSSSGTGVYYGAWNDSTPASKTVTGQSGNYVGDKVCTSGSFSGSICSIDIVSVHANVELEGYIVSDMIQGNRSNGTSAGGQGDSGGPVDSTSSTTDVFAKGVLSSGRSGSQVPCTGVTSGGRICFSTVYWVSVFRVLRDLNLSLNLG